MTHQQAIEEALKQFVAEYAPEDPAARYRAVRSGIGDNIHAVVSIARFADMRDWDRQNMLMDYLQDHLPDADRVFISQLLTPTPDEWDAVDFRPVSSLLAV
jgi:acid stress-induced BolA-like protein IbaG/YrbA